MCRLKAWLQSSSDSPQISRECLNGSFYFPIASIKQVYSSLEGFKPKGLAQKGGFFFFNKEQKVGFGNNFQIVINKTHSMSGYNKQVKWDTSEDKEDPEKLV